jgi:phenylalanyl-tRNA synthetase alpha chain
VSGPPLQDESERVESRLADLEHRLGERLAHANSEQELRAIRAEALGKKGELTGVLRNLGQVPADRRRALGERANAVKASIDGAFEARLGELNRSARQRELEARPHDLTLPGRVPVPRGHQHPITLVLNEILDIFRSLGFDVAWGPQVELEDNNFTKLAFPPDHPARDMQDSFWVRVEGGRPDARVLLRTHTSNVQVREMSSRTPPMAVVSGGPCYRTDDDVTHSPMFHQI